jgi:hypothetical protein
MFDRATGDLWTQFLPRVTEGWARKGFRQARVPKGVGFLRKLAETSQLVEYNLASITNSEIVFSIGLAVWSHRLSNLGRKQRRKLDAQDGHWRDNLINLMPLESAHMWWTVGAATLERDISYQVNLINETIITVLDGLVADADLVRVWRAGGELSGLTPLSDRAANAVTLAHALHGHDEALAVARDMAAIADKAGRERPAMLARLRQILELLPVSTEFLEATTDGELN